MTRALYKRNLLTPYHKRYPIHTSIRDIDHIDFSKPIVTCVRNPYDRFHSLYNFFIKIKYGLDISFEEFVSKYNKEYHGKYLYDTQMNYITIDGKIVATDILRFEHLEEDWAKLCKKYKINIELEHVRKVDKTGIVYTHEMKNVMKSIFAEDFKNFGYSV